MKTGTGDDPFADDDTDDDSDEERQAEPAEVETVTDADSAVTGGSDESVGTRLDSETSTVDSKSSSNIPWILRRQQVKDHRDNVHQFFLRDEYSELEDKLRTDVANELEMRTKEVKKLDLREAMVAVAAEHPQEVAETLGKWGYFHMD